MRDKVTLGELCNPSMGQVKENPDTVIDYIDISSVDNESKSIIGFQTMTFSEAPSRARKSIKKNNILVSTVRPNLNAVAVYEIETPNKAVVSTGFCVLDCKENVDSRFVFNFCRSKTFIEDMISQATGASYPAVNDKIVRASLVPKYSYEEQCKISSILDLISSIIENRKQQLQQLDDLVKARFVEMFGDPVRNDKGWNFRSLEEVTTVVTYGLTVRPEYIAEGVDLISARELHKGYVAFEEAPKISVDDFEKLSEKAKPKKNDILFSKTGSIGHCALVTEERLFAITQNAARISLKEKMVNPLWLLLYLRMDYIQNWCKSHSKGNAVKDFQLQDMKLIPLFDCPLEMQNEFATFVEQVYKSKVAVQKALDEAQTLFDSLMQEYFG